MLTKIKFESEAFRESFIEALVEVDRLRPIRFALLLTLSALVFFVTDLPIALSWAAMVASADLAVLFAGKRLVRAPGSAFHLSVAVALSVLANAAWTAGPLALWLYNAALADTAALWLVGLVVYQVIFFRRSLAYFALAASWPVIALLWVEVSSRIGDASMVAHLLVVSLLVAILVVGALRRASVDSLLIRDAAELRRRQKLGDDLADRLQLAVDAAGSIVWGIEFTEHRMFGQAQLGKLLGARFCYEDFMAGRLPAMPTEDRTAVAAALEEGLKTCARMKFEHRIEHPELGERWIRTAGVARRDKTGKLQRLVMLSTDVTDLRRLRVDFAEAMGRAEANLASKRALVEEIAGDFAATAIAPPAPANAREWDYPALHARLGRLLNEIDARDAALAHSMAQLRAARAAAELAGKTKTRFVSHMTHELRTPLNAVIGFSEILQEDLGAAKMHAQARDVGRIKRAAHNLLSLVNDVLDLAKIETGAMEASATRIHVPAFLADLGKSAQAMAEAQANRFVLEAEPALATLSTDKAKLRQCLTSLISNACKFTENGVVTLSVCAGEPGRVAFEISDTGEGIAAAKLANLFQPFSQGEQDIATRRNDGAGLGLAIAQRLAQLLDGEISVASVEGQGSVFTLTIASVLDGDEGEDARLEALAENAPIVLVIDDEANSRRLVRHALARVGFSARSAPTAEAGLDLAGRIEPALIVLDIRLPDRSGWDLLETLRGDPKTAQIPVLVLSIEDDRARALGLGACEHFIKPADRNQLAAAILRCARTRAAAPVTNTTPGIARTA